LFHSFYGGDFLPEGCNPNATILQPYHYYKHFPKLEFASADSGFSFEESTQKATTVHWQSSFFSVNGGVTPGNIRARNAPDDTFPINEKAFKDTVMQNIADFQTSFGFFRQGDLLVLF